MSTLPLEGIRIADFTWAWAGPYCTKLLGDMGAEVIRIESSKRLDNLRWWPPYKDDQAGVNRTGWFNTYNRNKLSLTLNLATPEGIALAKRVVSLSDAVVENFSPRAMRKLGLHYDVLRLLKPDVVMLSMSGFGSIGPYRDYVSYGEHISNFGGLTSLTGRSDGPPLTDSTALPDAASGTIGAFSLLAALHYRERTGRGQYIDLSQHEVIVNSLPEALMDYLMNGHVPKRMGNRDEAAAPHGVYRCLGDDDWVAIEVNDEEGWRALCIVMGKPDLASEGRFADARRRLEHHDELDQVIGAWTKEHPRSEIVEKLQALGVAANPTATNKDLVEDEHLRARGFLVDLDHPEIGHHTVPGLSWHFTDTPGRVARHAPLLGEHVSYVLTEVLGIPNDEVSRLTEIGVIT